jgi:mono/diheme cytochrome c family protein
MIVRAGFFVAILGLIASVSAASAASSSEAQGGAGQVELGAGYYRQYCGACHGATGKGDGPVASLLKVPPSDLTSIAARHGGEFASDEVAKRIDGRVEVRAHGPRTMPIWGVRLGEKRSGSSVTESLVEGKLIALIRYLESFQAAGPTASRSR